MNHITADICTKDRYETGLPLALMSIINQTRTPDSIIIYDDSLNRIDMRENETLRYIFNLFDQKKIEWEVLFGRQRGQHIGHQIIQDMAKDLVWRMDDDCIAEPNVLYQLESRFTSTTGAIGGLVLMPNAQEKECEPNSIINLMDNCQWYKWHGIKQVEHLYSSYLYRKGIQNYDLSLSSVAHREETLHSYGIFKKGYGVFVDSGAITWHLRSNIGGIRTGKPEWWHNDEITFQETLNSYEGRKIVFLDSGKGDHLVFKVAVLPKLKEKYKEVTLAVCWPEIFPEEKCISLNEGAKICNPENHNISKWMHDHHWDKELKFAYAQMYGVEI